MLRILNRSELRGKIIIWDLWGGEGEEEEYVLIDIIFCGSRFFGVGNGIDCPDNVWANKWDWRN